MIGSISKLIAATALLAAPIYAAHAQDKTDHQTMPSGRDVWRVELRNFDQVLLIENSDSDNKDELHSVEVVLANEYSDERRRLARPSDTASQKQFDAVKETARNLAVNDNAGNSAYVQARRGDIVELSRRPNTTYNLWIHTREFRESADLPPVIFFVVSVKTRELSCFRKRVCKRGYHGEYSYQFRVPVPGVRSSRCVAANTFEVEAQSDGIEVIARATGEPVDGWEIDRGPTRKSPQMFIKEAEICIASTSR